MSTKFYLTISAIVTILFALGFLLIPETMIVLFGSLVEPHVVMTLRFWGGTALGMGIIFWFARDLRDWDAVRGVLIGHAVALVVISPVVIWATLQGFLNRLAWGVVVLNLVWLFGALYCLSTGSRKMV